MLHCLFFWVMPWQRGSPLAVCATSQVRGDVFMQGLAEVERVRNAAGNAGWVGQDGEHAVCR